MSFEIPGFSLGTQLAAADLSAKQYFLTKIDTDGKVALCGDGESFIGSLCNKPESGEVAQVVVLGVGKVVAGGAITAGDKIASDADGKAKTAVVGTVDTSDGGAADDPVIGSHVGAIALSDAADGEVFSVLFLSMGLVPTTAA